jgi:3-oxoadipate enol-lactonase
LTSRAGHFFRNVSNNWHFSKCPAHIGTDHYKQEHRQMRFAAVPGAVLHYADEGFAGGLPLVFINSLGTDLRIWDDVLPRFSSTYRLIRYDKRGHGLSGCPTGPYSLDQLGGDLAHLLDQLGVFRAVLIGDSVGGMIAMNVALERPDRVAGLVLCDTAAKIGEAVYWTERITAVRSAGIVPLAEGVLTRWLSPAFIRRQKTAYQGYFHMLTRTPREGYAATCEAIRDTDLRQRVGQIAAPALVVCGAEDQATPPDMVSELADQLPDARFILIPDAGHIPAIEQPAELAAHIHHFLREIEYV